MGGGTYPQLGWLQTYRPECESAGSGADATKGCWCADSDWKNPLGDGADFRLTGDIPDEWVLGLPPNDIMREADESCGFWSGASDEDFNFYRKPHRQPPPYYGHPSSWKDGDGANRRAGEWDMWTYPDDPSYDASYYFYHDDHMYDSYLDDYGYTNYARWETINGCTPGYGVRHSTTLSGQPPWYNTLQSV